MPLELHGNTISIKRQLDKCMLTIPTQNKPKKSVESTAGAYCTESKAFFILDSSVGSAVECVAGAGWA